MAKNDPNPKPNDEEEEEEEGQQPAAPPAPSDESEEEEEEQPSAKKKPVFNFEKADPQTLAVLGAVGRALMDMSEGGQAAVGQPVMDFAKSAVRAAKKARAKISSDEAFEFAKSVLGADGIAAIQAPIAAKLSEMEKTVGKMQEDAELIEMKKTAADLPGVEPGNEESVTAKARQLLTIKKALSEADFDEYIKEQRGIKTQIAKSAVFARTSSNQTYSDGNSASEKITKMAEEMVSKSADGKLDLATAIVEVGRKNPELWREYQNEQRNRARVAAVA